MPMIVVGGYPFNLLYNEGGKLCTDGEVLENFVLLQTQRTNYDRQAYIFVKSIYTGSKTMTDTEYQAEFETVMNDSGVHEKICAVTSKNTG